jgi:hypothetical protein
MDNTKWKVMGFVAIAVAIIVGGIAVFNKR